VANISIASPASGNYLEGTLVRDSLRDVLTREGPHAAQLIDDWLADGVEHLFFVGCGGSRAIMEPVKWLLDRFAPLASDAYTGWEFVNRAPRRLDRHSAVVLASHSGSTEEVMLGLDIARKRGSRTVALTVPDSPLAQAADAALVYESPAVNLCKLLMVYLIAANLIARAGETASGQRLLASLDRLPDELQRVKDASQARGQELAAQFRDARGYYLLGGGPLAGLAYQFQACTLMEMQWLHASALNTGEFQHGPLEIVEAGLPVIILLGTDASRRIGERALAFCERRGAQTLVFDLAELPQVDPDLAPFAVHVALQWFAWYLSQEREHPLSTRRYMWKVPY
jgi:fructoselysine-6-P-deglycase FrlB-like protein